jgi:hypothetical protein
MIEVLETVRQHQRKARLYYSDTETDQSWFDEHQVIGRFLGSDQGTVTDCIARNRQPRSIGSLRYPNRLAPAVGISG